MLRNSQNLFSLDLFCHSIPVDLISQYINSAFALQTPWGHHFKKHDFKDYTYFPKIVHFEDLWMGEKLGQFSFDFETATTLSASHQNVRSRTDTHIHTHTVSRLINTETAGH